MLPREIIRQVRRLQLRARRAVEDLLGGEYHSVFRGAGIAFEEVRPYQPGDDVRGIDWNVTARMAHPYVKRFIEERERTVVLAMDVSASLNYGTGMQKKREVAGELAAILAFSAVTNGDRVGLVQFTDHIEHYLPATRGSRHILRLIRDVLFFEPQRKNTSLKVGLEHLERVLRKKSIVFLFSDFLDLEYESILRRTARRHELILVRLFDPREQFLPSVGLVQLHDVESGQQLLLDTSQASLREAYAERARRRDEDLTRLARSCGADVIEASTEGRHLDELLTFFERRQHRRR